MRVVMDESSMTGPALLVLLAIARSADRYTGECYLSRAEISERTRIRDIRRISQYLREAESAGELHTNLCAGRTGVNLYRIEIPGAVEESSPTPGKNAMGDGKNAVKLPGGGWQKHAQPMAKLPTGEDREDYERGEGTEGEPSAAEPLSINVGTADAGLRPSQAAVPAQDPNGSRLGKGLPPLATPFELHLPAASGADVAAWDRTLARAGAARHAGMSHEWATVLGDVCEARTWEEAGAALRAIIRAAKEDEPGRRKPVTPGIGEGYVSHGLRAVADLRRAKAKPAPASPEARGAKAPPPPTLAEHRARRLRGEFSPLEQHQLNSGRILNDLGDIIKPEKNHG